MDFSHGLLSAVDGVQRGGHPKDDIPQVMARRIPDSVDQEDSEGRVSIVGQAGQLSPETVPSLLAWLPLFPVLLPLFLWALRGCLWGAQPQAR